VFRVALLLQIVFYALAIFGGLLQDRARNLRLLSIAFYFCLVNLASLIACFKWLTGDLSGTWTPPRQKVPSKA
jgi:hypothetical protein